MAKVLTIPESTRIELEKSLVELKDLEEDLVELVANDLAHPGVLESVRDGIHKTELVLRFQSP